MSAALIRTKKIVWASVAVLGLLVVVALYVVKGTSSSSTEYALAEVKRGDVSKLVLATGVAVPVKKVDVGAQVSGQIRTLHVELGQSVKAGQLLAVIDPTLAQNELQQEMALLEQQEAGLNIKRIELSAARREVSKQQTMLTGNATTVDDVERATDQFEKSRAELRSVQAQVKQTKALIDSSNAKLAYTRIVAPIDGSVINIPVQQGQTVNAVQQVPTVMTLAQMERMTVRAKVPEADIARLSVGQKVVFNPLGNPERKTEGILQTLQPSPERVNGALFYSALFDVANTDRLLWPEMTVQVAFVTSQRKDVLLLPWSALGQNVGGNRYQVTLVDNQSKHLTREVLIGIDDGVHVEIKHGLKAGDKVVVPVSGVDGKK